LGVDGCVALKDFGKDGGVGEGLAEDLGIGDGGGIEFVLKMVENEAGEGQALASYSLDGEQGMIEGAEAVGNDEEDGEIEGEGEVGDGLVLGERDFPAAQAFDEDDLGGGGEFLVGGLDGREIDGSIGELGGGEGGDGGGIENGIDEADAGAGRGWIEA
jgi:hypothetical protein